MQELTIKTVWITLARVFREAGLDTPAADARLLVQWVFKMTHEELLIHSATRVITDEERALLESLAERRLKSEPVSRIIGVRAFWKSEFIVTPATLDPRHDSETLIEAALHHIKDAKRIIDCGTGTGCLLLSLLQEWPDATGDGIDISADAVDTAKKNAENMGLSGRARFVTSDWENYTTERPVDLVISNPPYIAESEAKDLAPDVALYDPPTALFAGKDGLDAYRSLLRFVPTVLKLGGWLILEIGHTQADTVKELLADAGFTVIETRRDLGGNDRAIVAKKH